MHHALRLLSLLAALPSALCQLIQVIKVREDDLTFEPSSLTAPVGSRVQFHFDHHNISIASSAFDDPCRPDGRVFSGYVPVVGRSGVCLCGRTVLFLRMSLDGLIGDGRCERDYVALTSW